MRKGEDGQFRASKILKIEGESVHIRLYRNRFAFPPKRINPGELTIGSVGDPEGFGIGHVPMSMAGFLSGGPIVIQNETVTEEELEGYQMWQTSAFGTSSDEDWTQFSDLVAWESELGDNDEGASYSFRIVAKFHVSYQLGPDSQIILGGKPFQRADAIDATGVLADSLLEIAEFPRSPWELTAEITDLSDDREEKTLVGEMILQGSIPERANINAQDRMQAFDQIATILDESPLFVWRIWQTDI